MQRFGLRCGESMYRYAQALFVRSSPLRGLAGHKKLCGLFVPRAIAVLGVRLGGNVNKAILCTGLTERSEKDRRGCKGKAFIYHPHPSSIYHPHPYLPPQGGGELWRGCCPPLPYLSCRGGRRCLLQGIPLPVAEGGRGWGGFGCSCCGRSHGCQRHLHNFWLRCGESMYRYAQALFVRSSPLRGEDRRGCKGKAFIYHPHPYLPPQGGGEIWMVCCPPLPYLSCRGGRRCLLQGIPLPVAEGGRGWGGFGCSCCGRSLEWQRHLQRFDG